MEISVQIIQLNNFCCFSRSDSPINSLTLFVCAWLESKVLFYHLISFSVDRRKKKKLQPQLVRYALYVVNSNRCVRRSSFSYLHRSLKLEALHSDSQTHSGLRSLYICLAMATTHWQIISIPTICTEHHIQWRRWRRLRPTINTFWMRFCDIVIR